jgi:hypothetical protein
MRNAPSCTLGPKEFIPILEKIGSYNGIGGGFSCEGIYQFSGLPDMETSLGNRKGEACKTA